MKLKMPRREEFYSEEDYENALQNYYNYLDYLYEQWEEYMDDSLIKENDKDKEI